MINVEDREFTNPEEITIYLINAVFRPNSIRLLPLYTYNALTLRPILAKKYLAAPLDEEVYKAFYKYGSNTLRLNRILLIVLKAA